MNHKWSNGVQISELSDAHIDNILRRYKMSNTELQTLSRKCKEQLVYEVSIAILEDDYDFRDWR